MIEIEKKFSVTDESLDQLLKDAELVKEVRQDDAYFDTHDFALARKRYWLRKRNGAWELKVPRKAMGANANVEWYGELETDDEIRRELSLRKSDDMDADVAASGYTAFVQFASDRRRYRVGEFSIDIDETDFGYRLAEIELMIPDGGDSASAEKRLTDFAIDRGLKLEYVRGKIAEALFRFKPEVFEIFNGYEILR